MSAKAASSKMTATLARRIFQQLADDFQRWWSEEAAQENLLTSPDNSDLAITK
jgi:hypothetical protein